MRAAIAGTALALLAWASAAQDAGRVPAADGFTEREVRRLLQHSPLGPPPADPTNAFADDPRAALLGQRLFFDKRLSRDGDRSCSSCHDPARGLGDGKRLSEGIGPLERHAPSLWNVAYQRWHFWDGRIDTLWGQAVQPLEHPLELGGNRARLARVIAGDDLLRAEYEALFGALPPLQQRERFPLDARPAPDEPALDAAWRAMAAEDREALDKVLVGVAKALAAYERRLVSRHAPFDTFVEGLRSGDASKLAALSPSAQRGARLFVGRADCRTCHAGPNFSDGEFHDLGVPPLAGGTPRDAGRYAGIERLLADPFHSRSPHSDARDGEKARRLEHLARNPLSWGEFKTPTLRNVALSPPYMHQGQFASLEEVLHYYSTLEGALPPGHHPGEQVIVALELSAGERADLRAFLESLTDTGADPALLAPPPPPAAPGD